VYAAVDDRQELVVTTRISEELGVDGDGAPRTTATRLTERVLYVEVAVAGVRNAAPRGANRVVASVSRTVKHEHRLARIPAASAGDISSRLA